MKPSRWRLRSPIFLMIGLAHLQLGAGLLGYRYLFDTVAQRTEDRNTVYMFAFVACNVLLVAVVGFKSRSMFAESSRTMATALKINTKVWLLCVLLYLVLAGGGWLYFFYRGPKAPEFQHAELFLIFIGSVFTYLGLNLEIL